jgi:hypothetical protein
MFSLLFSLSSLWTASRANGSISANGGTSMYSGLKDLHAQEMGGELTPGGPGWLAWAVRPSLVLDRFGHRFAPVGPHFFMYFASSIGTILTMSSSHPRWRFSLHDFVSLQSLPPLRTVCGSKNGGWSLPCVMSD